MATNSGDAAAGTTTLASWRRLDAGDTLGAGGFIMVVGAFSLAVMAFQLAFWLIYSTDYVGVDPDDAMRLVEVRDYLGGQGWFDLQQYRLGPDGGTLMHWSRLIDWPIAMLIRAYGLFLAAPQAEVAALVTWPLLLVVPLFASMGLASYRLGGKAGMLIGLILLAAFLAAIVRFRPGAIDHHNVQLILATFMAATLIDPLARASNFAAAAVAGALALAIGAETTPLVAVAGMVVAVLWAIHGERYRGAAIAFGLTFAIATGAIFFGTTPVRLYAAVTCDTLSVGYLLLSAVGGACLAVSAFALTDKPVHVRFTTLGLAGVLVLATAVFVSPQCLQNPLNELHPLLKAMWLSGIKEAQSIVDLTAESPGTIGGFYAVGLIALAVSLMRVVRGELVLPHAILFALIAISWLVSAVQVRGMVFANILAFIPLSALIADLRALYVSRQKDMRAAAAFALSALLSVPSVWTLGGVLAFEAGAAVAGVKSNATEMDEDPEACVTSDTMRKFAAEPPGRILSSPNVGGALLRFTPHAVLTANYHRNQAGMVAALEMSMAKPGDALPMMEAAGVSYVLICEDDPTTGIMKAKHPDGLYARLAVGEPPGYLEELPESTGTLRLYRMIQR